MRCAIVVILLVVGIACGSHKPQPPPETYHLHGVVMRVDASRHSALIKHEKIEGWMEAMTMEFPVKEDAEFAKIKPGMEIHADVKQVPSDYDFWITNIRPVEKSATAP